MCGIGGYILKDKRKSLSKELQLNAVTMLVELQDRGEHAWGMYLEKHGEKPQLYCGEKCDNIKGELFKKPKSVKDFFEEQEGTIFLDKTHTILMHTRASTAGKPENNENNHPFNTEDFILAHNGVIRNPEKIYKEFKIKTDIECDSYAIIALIQHFYNENGKKDVVKAINLASEHLEGSYACWLYDKKSQDVYLFRKTSPLEYYIDKDNGVFVFASKDDQIIASYNNPDIKACDCHYIESDKIFRVHDNDLNEVGELVKPTYTASSWNRGSYNNFSNKGSCAGSNQMIDTSKINESLSMLFEIFEWYDPTPATDPKTGIYICDNEIILLVEPEYLIEVLDKTGFSEYKQKVKAYNTNYYQYTIAPIEKLNGLVKVFYNYMNGKCDIPKLTGKSSDIKDDFKHNEKGFEDAIQDLAETISCSFRKIGNKYIFEYQGQGLIPKWIKRAFKKEGMHFRKNNIMRVPINEDNVKKLRSIMEATKIYFSSDGVEGEMKEWLEA